MTKKDAHLFLPLVQALADGKTLQIEVGNAWNDLDEPSFTRPPQDYRIKPEPRVWKVWIDQYGYMQSTNHLSKPPAGWTQIEVIEILPENKQ